MNKTLYIHIGTHKTATTTIQKFLENNQEQLDAQGIGFPIFPFYYPGKAANRNALFLTWTAVNEFGEEDPAGDGARFDYAMQTIHQMFETHDTVILTDEALWRRLFYNRKEVLPALVEDGAAHGYTVKGIIYLRRQDEFIESMWNQMVKMRTDYTTAFDDYIDQYRHKYLYYDKILPWYADTLGEENFIVKRFADSIRGDGIVADFMRIVGLELTEEYVMEDDRSNIGLYGNTVRIKQLINGIHGDMNLSETNMYRNALTMLSADAKKEYPCSEFSEETRRAFMQRFEEGNAAIAERFFDDGRPLFSEDYSGKPKRETDNPWILEDAIRSAAATDLQLYRRQTYHLEILRHADEILLNREKEMLVRLKVLERAGRRQEKQIASLERKVDHLRHPLRRLLEKLRSLFGGRKAEEEPEVVSIIDQEMPEEDLPDIELPDVDFYGQDEAAGDENLEE